MTEYNEINSIEVNSIILEAQKKKIRTVEDLNSTVKKVLSSESINPKIDVNNLPIHSSKYDSEKLYQYLIHDCSMNEKRIQNSFKKNNIIY